MGTAERKPPGPPRRNGLKASPSTEDSEGQQYHHAKMTKINPEHHFDDCHLCFSRVAMLNRQVIFLADRCFKKQN